MIEWVILLIVAMDLTINVIALLKVKQTTHEVMQTTRELQRSKYGASGRVR